MQCFCGRAPNHFGWYDPIQRSPVIPCCSIACMDVVKETRGNMTLLTTERDAMKSGFAEHAGDIMAFFAGEPSEEEFYEFMGWMYETACAAVAAEYAKPITGDDVPY